MSFGHSSAVRFDTQHNGGPGIFWDKSNPKVEKRKFGYKSKNLRHEIRQPDHTELILELERKREEEKKKFNKSNKDFIQKNRQRYKPKEQVPPPGSTQIGPGTVTLTQDQLAALLASLNVMKGEDNSDNPLKISFDAKTNKIEVEKYESEGSGDENEKDDDDDHEKRRSRGGSPGGGIYDLLVDGAVSRKSEKRKKENKRQREEDERPRRSQQGESKDKADESPLNTARSTLEEAKREAGVSHITPSVPLKHMTVGERKRLQWAMERAELEKSYDPWGRPGAGAPLNKAEEASPRQTDPRAGQTQAAYDSRVNSLKTEQKQQQEDLMNDIVNLRKEIQQAEKKKEAEQKIIEKLLEETKENEAKMENKKEKNTAEKVSKKEERQKVARQERRRKTNDGSKQREEHKDQDQDKENGDEEKVKIIFITKKKGKEDGSKMEGDRTVTLAGSDKVSEKKPKRDSSKNKKEQRQSYKTKTVSETLQERDQEREGKSKRDSEKQEERPPTVTKAARSFSDDPENAYLTKKEIERRKWVEELNKQREEQRLKKQLERERDKAGVDDQWADRFVYHKTPQQTSPRRNRGSPREEVSMLGRVKEAGNATQDAPAAMRSSIIVGAGTLNETRYDSHKAEEKRQWLEELEKQREEKRQQMAALKEKQREEDGMWADRYRTDHLKLNQQGPSKTLPRANPLNPPPQGESPRVSSAPEPAGSIGASLRDSQELPNTFLRGQGVYVDPVTRREQEEKRKTHLQYQAEIKAQIEEKERQKREERERKAREDMEEERKFQMERERVLRQEEMEHKRTRDREAIQQKQLASLKSAMEEAQEKAMEEKNLRRIHHLQQRGHDVSQLKATYEEPDADTVLPSGNAAITPRIKEFESSAIPGLGRSGSSPPPAPLPSEQHFIPAHPAAHIGPSPHPPSLTLDPHQWSQPRINLQAATTVSSSYAKDPYTEDRVLTPSRLRNPSKPRDLPDSPKREFGTQTLELKDLQAILSNLPDEIQIEYKMKVEEALRDKQDKRPAPARKVHSKSAEAGAAGKALSKPAPPGGRKEVERKTARMASKERPLKLGERPQWNQRRTRTLVKNSEKDPFYQQTKEESEARKAKRERQLQYLQELNKERIPNLSPTRARPSSPDQMTNHAAAGDRGRQLEKNVRKERQGGKRGAVKDSSPPNILTLTHDIDSRNYGKRTGRSVSPPLPTVKHNTVSRTDHHSKGDDPYSYTNSVLKYSQTDDRYGDHNIALAPVHDGEFVPFTRTTEILDPAKADEPLAISRENSRMERARKSYHETRRPADRGKPINVYQDREREMALKAQTASSGQPNDPILHPHLVTEHPTDRQGKILQQLSSLKQNLMQRRRELENYMSPSQLE